MASRPHIRVRTSYRTDIVASKPMPSSWELHLLQVSDLCPCAVNLGTAEFLSVRGRWAWGTMDTTEMHAGPAQTSHSPQYSTVHRPLISHYYYAQRRIAAHLPGECSFFFIRIRKSLVWLLWSLADRCNLNKYLPRPREGHDEGGRSVASLVAPLEKQKKEDKDLTAR